MSHDPTDEPCFLTPEDDESMLDPPLATPVGPPWWEGRWPEGGIHSLDELERWVDDRLAAMISMDWHSQGSLGQIARIMGRQALRNANRYLDRFGHGDHPPMPTPDKLDHIEQIEAALAAVLRHIRRERGQEEVGDLPYVPADENPRANEPKPERHSAQPQLRTWSQGDLDDAIRKYKALRADQYSNLVDGVRRSRPGALKVAREIYGRNAIARALGVKASAMVSKSPVWREIAEELRLVSEKGRALRRSGKIGLDLAVEAKAETEGGDVLDLAVSRETLSLIKKHLPAAAAETLAHRLYTGDTTDDEAREMVKMYLEQQADRKSNKVF
jgi:hypothetical protein